MAPNIEIPGFATTTLAADWVTIVLSGAMVPVVAPSDAVPTASTPLPDAEPTIARERSGASLQGLEALLKQQKQGHPPVHLWNPPYCGEVLFRIGGDGTWYYLGSPIGRKPLVKLFASVLRKDEDGRTYLVTPVEKVGVEVDDAHFMAVEMSLAGKGREQQLRFRTQVDDWIACDAEHPLRFGRDPRSDGLKPYLSVRGRLEALLTRTLYYDLVEVAAIAPVGGIEQFGVWSGGVFFAMAPAAGIESLARE
jgi:uncharacterized protein